MKTKKNKERNSIISICETSGSVEQINHGYRPAVLMRLIVMSYSTKFVTENQGVLLSKIKMAIDWGPAMFVYQNQIAFSLRIL